MEKVLLIVLDGAADYGEKTPYQTAEKPNMDRLASEGLTGLLDLYGDMNLKSGKDVESDIGFLRLLGVFSKKDYPGRGYLEAIAVDMEPGEKDVCIRGNFATLGYDGTLINRRAGRDDTGLSEICSTLDGTEIDGVHFQVVHGEGHRVVIVLSGKDVSPEVGPNDPKETGVAVRQIMPVIPKGKKTASVLNRFLYQANKLLSSHPINKSRKIPANTILIRNTGMKKTTESLKDRYGLNGCCIGGVPISRGVSRYLGMDVIDVPGASGMPDADLKAMFNATGKALQNHDFIFLHINGADILAHDGNRKDKTEFLSRVDRELGAFLKKADLSNLVIAIASDHGTASNPDYKLYRHLKDPVPVLIWKKGLTKIDRVRAFDEKSCMEGSLKLKGNELMGKVLEVRESF